MNKKIKYSIILSFFLILHSSCQTQESKSWTLVPYPNSVFTSPGVFTFNPSITIIASDSSLNQTISLFKKKFTALEINTNAKSHQIIELALTSSNEMTPEGYQLDISERRIKLTASNPNGIFYGLMTIWQELKFSKSKAIPCGLIKDEPRFEYRGFMLDESRHFFGKEKVMQIIDLMAMFKLNTFHWHLTDQPGWRLEIKAFPKLSALGGKGNLSNPNGAVQYYSQEDIKEVINYAKERYIEIIPEIDMPGHAAAANRAYPEFSGGGSKKHPEFTFDVGKESTYSYLNTILEEVSALFPSKYIHLGGDEVHFGNENWKTNDSIQSLMKREGLETLLDMEHYFMKRMKKQLHKINKNLAGWDEIVESDISKEKTLVFWWRHDKPEQLEKALAKGFNTVLCPRIPFYLDFVQHERDTVGRRWGGNFGTVEKAYNYPDSTHEFSLQETALIKGLQANLWTETVESEKRLDYMIFPRIIALSESAWTNKNNKDLSRFNKNLVSVFEFLDEQNIFYFNSLNPSLSLEPTK